MRHTKKRRESELMSHLSALGMDEKTERKTHINGRSEGVSERVRMDRKNGQLKIQFTPKRILSSFSILNLYDLLSSMEQL